MGPKFYMCDLAFGSQFTMALHLYYLTLCRDNLPDHMMVPSLTTAVLCMVTSFAITAQSCLSMPLSRTVPQRPSIDAIAACNTVALSAVSPYNCWSCCKYVHVGSIVQMYFHANISSAHAIAFHKIYFQRRFLHLRYYNCKQTNNSAMPLL